MSGDPILSALAGLDAKVTALADSVADLDEKLTAGFDRLNVGFARLDASLTSFGAGQTRLHDDLVAGFDRLDALADAIRQDIVARRAIRPAEAAA
jgi:hypothetical protein